MTGEGGEYGGRRREEYREYDEDEDPRKEARELIDEVEREQSNEGKEKREHSEDDEYRREAQELIDEAREEKKREQTEADEQQEQHWRNEAEECVKEVVMEIEHEEEEEKRTREEAEEEHRQFQEHGREERIESAEDDNLSEWEKDVLENYEKYGANPEEMRELWREHFAKDIEDELEGSDDGRTLDEKQEGEPDDDLGLGKTEDTESYYDDGSGQMYAVKSESKEQAESKTETETTEETHKIESEPTESPEGDLSKENTEPKNVQSETDETTQSEEREPTEHQRNSSQECVEEPKTSEDVPKKVKEKEYQEKRTATTSTAEYSEEMEEKQSETKGEKKIESSNEAEVAYERSQDAREDIETSMNQEIEEEESSKSDPLDELSPEEERWQRGLNEMFNRLSEEFQEAIKKYLEEKVEDEKDFEKLAEKHGLEDMLEDEEVMEEIRQFLRYRNARRVSPEASTEELAEEVGIDPEKAEKWNDRMHFPDAMKKVLNLEGHRVLDNLARGFREHNYPVDLDELDEYLQDNPRIEFEDPIAPFEQWKREARAWTEITKMRRKGKIKIKLRNGRERYDREQIEGLSKKYGVSKERIVSWLLGNTIPYLIERISKYNSNRYENNVESHVDTIYQVIFKMYYEDGLTLRAIAQELNMDRNTISKKFKEKGWEIERRIGKKRNRKYSVIFWHPQVNGVNIDSIEQLIEYIRKENSGLLSRKDFPVLIEQARLHFELVRRFSETGNIHYGEISKLAEEFDTPPETLRYLLRKAGRPRVYYLLEQVSMDDRTQLVSEMLQKLNGVNSIKEMDHRLKNLYFYKEILKSTNYVPQRKLSVKYFQFWKEYLKGGTREDIGRKLGIGNSTMTEWLKFTQIPTHAKHASLIPKEKPEKGWKWLPLKLNTVTNTPEFFIKVPVIISTPDDLLKVLEQIVPLSTIEMKKLVKKLSPISRHLEFIYLLGLIVSDGGFSHNIEYSAKVQLYVSKKYPWGLNLGRAFCFAMGQIGFNTERWADDIRYRHGKKQECMVWGCETSPFFAWMEKGLLGLDLSTAKSKQSIDADWILMLPREWRAAFVQGLADGDGYASIKSLESGIATTTNQEFVQKLLESLSIESRYDDTSVRIARQKAILDATELSLFRYASGRKRRLYDLSNMIRSLKRKTISNVELQLINHLHDQSLTAGEIAETLWYKHGIARSPGSIYGILHRKRKTTQT